MHGLACLTNAEESARLLQIPVVELAAKASPRVLRLPNEHARVPLPHVSAETFEQRAVLNVIRELSQISKSLCRDWFLAVDGDLIHGGTAALVGDVIVMVPDLVYVSLPWELRQ